MDGFSFYVCVGRYGGFYFERSNFVVRLVLG